MINIRREGEYLKVGLNITFGVNERWYPWVTFNWMWYHAGTHTLSYKRLRLRTWKLKAFTSSGSNNVIETYLRHHELMAFPREFAEDLALCYDMTEVDRLFNQYRVNERLAVWQQR